MEKTLILVRHGQAAPATEQTPDALRPLTEAGCAALNGADGFPRTFALLSPIDRAQAELWTSSAVRAQETARAVAAAIGQRPIRSRDDLFEQDEASVLNAMLESDARCIIAVGHIPFMDRVTEYLTGANLLFHPGAAAAIRLNGTLAPMSADLLWFVQGPDVAQR